ncbi:MAG: DNA replication and repair protein RecF [Oscillospiraceae bacterium]|jgi:DNA replication and repair protein RecF|nr:DNA replication and repair protein RecF [Oscillospiraceae bacterium]
MEIRRLELCNFRNIKTPFCFEPQFGVNVISGKNAQGKTNLLEAVWLLTGERSFRGGRDGEIICHGQSGTEISADIFTHGYVRKTEISITQQRERKEVFSEESTSELLEETRRSAPKQKCETVVREVKIGGVSTKKKQELAENFAAVIFAPSHLSLVRDGPEKRRTLFDSAISRLRPRYVSALTQYSRAVMGRNAILRDVKYHGELLDLLGAWEEKIAVLGTFIIRQRMKYIAAQNEIAPDIYGGLSSGKETFRLNYLNTDPDEQTLLDNLHAARKNDMITGTTSAGPHRDDMEFCVNGKSARIFGSQGQQRSAVIAVKLAEATIAGRAFGEPPVMLLDDVLSELDISRQRYVLNHVGAGQILITCCDSRQTAKATGAKRFVMENGILKEKQ